jgi:hypothetical protein
VTEPPQQQPPKPQYYSSYTIPEKITSERSGPSLSRGIIAAVLAAVIGGVVWAIIVVQSGYEVGFVAWGIGIFAGFLVAYLARGVTPQLQVVAVLASGIGILIGKYVTFVHELRVVADDLFSGSGPSFGYFAGDSFRLFRENLGDVFSFHDLIWIGLAVASAWRIAEVTAERFFPVAPPAAAADATALDQ